MAASAFLTMTRATELDAGKQKQTSRLVPLSLPLPTTRPQPIEAAGREEAGLVSGGDRLQPCEGCLAGPQKRTEPGRPRTSGQQAPRPRRRAGHPARGVADRHGGGLSHGRRSRCRSATEQRQCRAGPRTPIARPPGPGVPGSAQ